MKIADSINAAARFNGTLSTGATSMRAANEPRNRWRSVGRKIAKRGTTSTHSGFLAALAASSAAILIASAVVAATLNDSGWSAAKPSNVLDEHPSHDPAMRIAISQVLELSQVPLLPTPAPNVSSPNENPSAESSRSALGAIETDGWRRTSISLGHSADATRPAAAPGRPMRPAELECGGSETRGNAEQSHSQVNASTTQNDSTAAPAEEPSVAATDESDDSNADKIASSLREQLADTSTNDSAEVSTPADAGDSATTGGLSQTVTVRRIPLVEEAPQVKKRPEETPLVEPLKGPLPPMTKSMQNLRNKVRTVLKMYYNKPQNSRDNDPWEMMHGMLAYGLKSQIREGGPKGDLITAVGWLCYNKPSKGLTLMYVTPDGELRAKQGAGLQGHMGQLLAMLAQCRVSPDYPIKVGDHDFTIRDLIEVEKKTCYEKTELTFKLIGLMHYLDSDTKWVNDQGMEWDIPKLISEEMAQPIRGAACGGTHRLSGLSLAARTRVRRGEPLDGEFAAASEFVEKYHNYAFQLQNSDGSLSTEWFRGKGDDDDIDRRVKTTGHILEWLCYSLSDDQMRSNRVFAATNYLATVLYSNYDKEWEKGPVNHAIHALRLYDERMLQPYDSEENIASQKPTRASQTDPKSRAQKR
jgi:hypothetical protein